MNLFRTVVRLRGNDTSGETHAKSGLAASHLVHIIVTGY